MTYFRTQHDIGTKMLEAEPSLKALKKAYRKFAPILFYMHVYCIFHKQSVATWYFDLTIIDVMNKETLWKKLAYDLMYCCDRMNYGRTVRLQLMFAELFDKMGGEKR